MILSDKLYNVLKWIALICLPALATLIGVLFATWGIPYSEQIVTTINAIGLFIGALIGISAYNFKGEE